MSDSTALSIYSEPLRDRMEYASELAKSNLLPPAYLGKPENVLIAMEYGASLNIPPMQALQGINVINGKATASADLMAALVRRAGHKLRIEGDDRQCTATVVRADDPDHPMSATWTMEKAARAGLPKRNPTWGLYPAAMLRARAISDVARMAANDALHGIIYTPEELESVNVPATVEQVEPVPTPRPVSSGEQDDDQGGACEEVDAEVMATQSQQQRITELSQQLGVNMQQVYLAGRYVLKRDIPVKDYTQQDAQQVIAYMETRLAQRQPQPEPGPGPVADSDGEMPW